QEAQHGTQMLSMSDTEQILRAGKPLHELKKSKPAASTYQDIADIEKAKPEVEVESIDVPEQAPPVAEPESEEFEYEEEYEEDDTQPIPTVAAEKKPSTDSTTPSAVDQLADLVSQKMKGDHLEDLNNLIDPKQRKKFIKRIFKKRESQYQEFIGLVNNTPTWKHASNLIDTFFYQQGLNPYSREALEFSDLVYNRYFPKDISINKGEEFRN
ncbi:MAG: hypothetical protein KDE62_11995, partial [Calditrichaeota bacterium]|nr:hypothetical protein [Calditrichota bacterium]